MALEDFRADAMRCTRCTYCRWIPFDKIKSARFAKGCPSIDYGKFHTYSAGGRLITALSLMDGRSTVTDRVKDAAFKCTMCGQCDVSCKVCRYDMEPLDAMRELRFTLVEQGHTIPATAPVIDSLRRQFNMLGRPAAERGDWAKPLEVKDLSTERGEVCFHAGCRYSFDGDLGHVARTSVKILQKAGVDVGIFGTQEHCCGGRAWNMGYREDLAQKARRNLNAWEKAGVKTVVTPCADCFHAFKRTYPAEAGSTVEVLHMTQCLDRLLQDGQLAFAKDVRKKVTYHDPCKLGRQGEDYVPWKGTEKKIFGQAVAYDPPRPRYSGAFGVYDAPRNILKAIPGVQLVEMERTREAAWCCGAGGGAYEMFPDFAKATVAERLDEAASTDADAIATACPWCERMFTDNTSTDGHRLEVLDVIALAGRALGIEEGI